MTLRKYQFSRNKDQQVKYSNGFRFIRGTSQGDSEGCTYCFLPVDDNNLWVAQNNQWVGPFGLIVTGGQLGGSVTTSTVGRLRLLSGSTIQYHPMFE
jgi:hypothetical protein